MYNIFYYDKNNKEVLFATFPGPGRFDAILVACMMNERYSLAIKFFVVDAQTGEVIYR